MTMTKPTSEQVTFLAAGSGATQRTALEKLRDVVSVKDFGAKGDNATDDAAAIQAAINATQSSGGGIVFMPAGIYRISQTLTIPANAAVMLMGVGQVDVVGGTRIRWIGSDNSSMIDIDDYNSIKDMHIFAVGSYSNLTGIDAKGTVGGKSPSGIILDNVSVKGVTNGFYFNYGWYNSVHDCFALYCQYGIRLGTESNNFGFYNCHIAFNSVAGIYFEGTGSRGNVFDSCSIESNAVGVDCSNGSPEAVTFKGCYVEANTSYDMILDGFQVVVDTCFFNGISGCKAIKIAGGNGISLRNNLFLGAYTVSDVYEIPAVNPGMARHGLQLGDDQMGGSITGSPRATAIASAPWLITDYVLDMPASNVTYLVSKQLDASASQFDWIVFPGQDDVVRKTIVGAFLVAETSIVTNNTFRVRIGFSGAGYDQLFDTTYTGTIAVGASQLSLLVPTQQVLPYPTHAWRYNNAAGTSGTYRIVLVLSP